MSNDRADSVGIETAMPVYLQGVKDGLTMDQIAEKLGMNGPSLSTKISTARTQVMVATRVYADPDAEGQTVKGAELMKRFKLDARQLKKRKDLTVITEGRSIPGAASSGGQRSTGGVDALVSLMDKLMGDEPADESGDEAEAAAETAESADGETAEDSDESAE